MAAVGLAFVMLRLLLAGLHLLALGIGLGAIWSRAAALRQSVDRGALHRAFRADTLWGLAAIVWIGTGVWRVWGATEKPATYYLHNHLFYAKMGVLALILVLEVGPMITLIRWRQIAHHGTSAWSPSPAAARRIATISTVQAFLIVLMVFIAVSLARGYGS